MSALPCRAALLVSPSDELALDLHAIFRGSLFEWDVMLARNAEAARAVLVGCPVDLAVVAAVPGAALEALLAELRRSGTLTFLLDHTREYTCAETGNCLTRLSVSMDAGALEAAIRPVVCQDTARSAWPDVA